jgi:hypothetical protein
MHENMLQQIFILDEIYKTGSQLIAQAMDEDHSSFPFAELTLCSGFFVIYFIEALVHRIFRIQSHSHGLPTELTDHGHGHGHGHGHSHSAPVENGTPKIER